VDVGGNNVCCCCWQNFTTVDYPEVPTVWGRTSFQAVTIEGYFFRQYFTTSGATPSNCFAASTPTPGPPQTPGPTRTPYPCQPTAFNADMEATTETFSNDATAYANWYAVDAGNCTETQVSSQAHGGTYSLELDVNDTSGAGSCSNGIYWVQNLGCPNTTCPYTICVWAKTSSTGDTGAYISVEQYNSSGTRLTPLPSAARGDLYNTIGGTAWAQYCITVGGASAPFAGTMHHLRIVLANEAPLSQVWYDDVTVTQSCVVSTPTSTATRRAEQMT
jgi:hypothetical protein